MKNLIARLFHTPMAFLQRFPIASFLAVLAIFFGLILLGNALRQPKTEDTAGQQKPVVEVETYEASSDEPAYVTVQAKVEAQRSIKVIAQQAGVVQTISVEEGDEVKKGQKVVSLSSTYDGASAPVLQRQLAQTQYNSTVETYDVQNALIGIQRQLAETQLENSEEMREMTERSISDTTNVIDLNESLRNSLRDSLEVLQQDPATNAATIAQARGTIAQLEGSLAQLYAGLRASRYQADPSNPPQYLARLGRDATLRQLELQEKGLDTAKKAAEIQLKLAQLQESLMMPTAPQAGVVERVYVKTGDTVAPGMPLYQIKLNSTEKSTKIVGYISDDTAVRVARTQNVDLKSQNGKLLSVGNYYISEEPTDGFSHAVTAYVSDVDAQTGSYVELKLPLVVAQEQSVLIPVDAVYQTQTGAYVYVIDGEVAKEREVKLGTVVGGWVEAEGLGAGERVILNRNIVEGARVRSQ